jgi:hypothetical protein
MNKKYWLWIGIIGAILSILVYQFIGLNPDWVSYVFLPAVLYIVSGPGMIMGGRSLLETYLAFAANGFIYGAIIGLIFMKVKNRQRGTTTN